MKRRAKEQQSQSRDGPSDQHVFISVVVPAYNEEQRLGGMLEEAVEFLQRQYATSASSVKTWTSQQQQQQRLGMPNSDPSRPSDGRHVANSSKPLTNPHADRSKHHTASLTAGCGWEILIVSDGSTDRTVETALDFARTHQRGYTPGTDTRSSAVTRPSSTPIPHGSIRVVSLAENRGKGGAVVHGLRHARGQYVVFADADGASRFADVDRLLQACREVEDARGRGIAIGSRAHLAGSDVVVKVGFVKRVLSPDNVDTFSWSIIGLYARVL